MRSAPYNPLSKLDSQEMAWLFGILKDACRERLEKNLVSQMMEARLIEKRGPLPGRLDPLPKLKEWEPRYRKLLAVAGELHEHAQAAHAEAFAEILADRVSLRRKGARRATAKGC
ncbi:MAG: hypothetical protein ACE15B_12545 [Bryobacteraceae bacterium]